ncbi:hypothetical protein SPBR_07549 [Sporothrix brasiliensis 5110]|uniref:Uncharacterized protein n=1 Tax=Sporothrix brasiliensis 5110 TaxID=1398154 RepID=A0A0C2IU45_9PEZI|nr:uncharacterized protein SPBR_07549 [Sporothrix brasiliensis 5110]KIH88517.1 hypothetical protein SPBR_07549 [Sporothrix brasiliensis 5110]
MTGQIQGITEPRWQERKPSSPPRPPLPPPLHRSAPSPSQRPLSLPQQSQHKRKNNLPRHPELWVPRISSPLRQAQLSSPYQAHNPEPQNLPSPRPNSADVSPLTPPPQSPARDKALSPERKTLFAVPDTGSQPSIYGTQDPAIVEALLVAEEEKGEPLLEWESETIKASRGSKARTSKVHRRSVFCRWERDPCANRAASESSSTALAFLLKSMTGMPSKEQKQMGIVSIGSVSQKCLQPSEAVAAVTTVPTVPAIDYEARAQQALLYENDGSSNDGSSCGDYTTIWPESSYYFSSNPGTAIEKRHRSQPTPTNRSSRSRSNRSSAESNALKRESHASKTTETRQVHFAPPL